MSRRLPLAGSWLVAWTTGGALIAVVIAMILGAEPVVLIAAPVFGAVVGFLVAGEILGLVLLVAEGLGLDEDGAHFRRIRAFVKKLEDSSDDFVP